MSDSHHRYDLLKKRLDVFTRMLHGIDKGDVRALHRTRVASRRLRELLPLLQLDADRARKLTRRLRRVTDGLGAVRELDVLNMLLEELHECGRYRQGGLSRITAAISHERNVSRKRLESKLPTAELHRVADKLDEILHELEPQSRLSQRHERAWRWAIDARIASRAEKLADAMRAAGAVYLAERLHDVRIAMKKLRYAVELAVEADGGKTSPELKTLKHAQELLGRLHDRQVLIDRVRQLQAADAADIKTEHELELIVDALENDCRRLHARYVRDRAAIAEVCSHAAAGSAGGSRGAPRRAASRRLAS